MYTIREAASRAGVTADVLRAWERRYQIVEPRRTSGGYRQYDEAAIRRVRAMRRMVEDGWTPSAAAESLRDVVDADLPEAEALPDASPDRRTPTTSVTVSSERLPKWNRPPYKRFSTRWARARRSRRWWTDTSFRRSSAGRCLAGRNSFGGGRARCERSCRAVDRRRIRRGRNESVRRAADPGRAAASRAS